MPTALPDRTEEVHPTIVFVHGNGDSSALWHATVWRFESNGWPTSRLIAFDMTYPLARDDDTVFQPGRSGTQDQRDQLAAQVRAALHATGAGRIALVASSRGGYAVRSFLAGGCDAAQRVSHAVLCGTPNHGVWALPGVMPQSEFNGAGPFLDALNGQGPECDQEVSAGTAWMTLRSDHCDKYAQPYGTGFGAPELPTMVTDEGPSLRGALNIVLPGADHREVAFSAEAFGHIHRFLVGREPARITCTLEDTPQLDGKVFGLGIDNRQGDEVNNLPLAGATVEVFAVDAATGERLGAALHHRKVGADGRWGPARVPGHQALEFVIAAEGFASTHIYRGPFARSSALVHLQAGRLPADLQGALAHVTMNRPRGYFSRQRDHISLDGVCPPQDIPPGVPSVAATQAWIRDQPHRAVVGEFNGERIVGRAWPAAEGHWVQLELQG